jgi:hypothetical protein
MSVSPDGETLHQGRGISFGVYSATNNRKPDYQWLKQIQTHFPHLNKKFRDSGCWYGLRSSASYSVSDLIFTPCVYHSYCWGQVCGGGEIHACNPNYLGGRGREAAV